MGSIPFYREAAARHGLLERHTAEMTEHMVTHYARVLTEIERRHGEMVEMCGAGYVESMKVGLEHWVSNGREGNLAWGVLVFEKV
jgi:sarcosine/dimethylglycine N-methyltransferase